MSVAPQVSVRLAYLAYHEKILFSDLTFTLSAGKCTALLGPSGVGKTSLLRLIAGLPALDAVTHAEIVADNGIAPALQTAYMAQTDLLLPWLTVLDNTLVGMHYRATSHVDHLLAKTRALDLLQRVGLGSAVSLYPQALSGGMRQRVALVRTLVEDQAIVLMDEPFSALDAITRFKLQDLSAELLVDKTRLIITHDPSEALRLADEIIIMSGLPATLSASVKLHSKVPRDPSDPDFVRLHAELFHELTRAHEVQL